MVLPADNKRDWLELDEPVRAGVEAVFADSYEQVRHGDSDSDSDSDSN